MKYEEGENGKVLVFEESDLDDFDFTKHWDIKEDECDKKYTETDSYKRMEELIKNENIDVEATIEGNDYKDNPIEFLIKELFWRHKYMPIIEEEKANTSKHSQKDMAIDKKWENTSGSTKDKQLAN